MSKIYCYSLDYKNKTQEFENMDALLKKHSGSKDQAEKALNNPDLSYRGFRLVSSDKLPDVLAQVMTKRTEKIKSDYVDNITSLEQEIKSFTKSERKLNTKMSVLTEEYEEQLLKESEKAKSDIEALEKENLKTIEAKESEHKSKIDELTSNFKKEILDLDLRNAKDIQTFNREFDTYTTYVQETVAEHNKYLNGVKTEYNIVQEKNTKNLTDSLNQEIKNKDILISKLSFRINEILKTSKSLELLLNNMIVNENRINSEDKKAVDFKVDGHLEKVTNNFERYTPIKTSDLLVNKELALDSLAIKKSLKGDSEKSNDVKVTVKAPDKVEDKSEKKEEKPEVKKVPENVIVKGVLLKSEDEYKQLSDVTKGSYLYNMLDKGLHKEDLPYGTVLDDLENPEVLKTILTLMKTHDKLFSDFEKDLNREKSLDIFSIISSTRLNYDKFFDIEAKKPMFENALKTTEEKSKTSEKRSLLKKKQLKPEDFAFDWKEFIHNYSQNDSVKLILSKEAISIKEASSFLRISSSQIKNMISTLVNVGEEKGYTKQFTNASVISPDEFLLLLVSDGLVQTSKRTNSEETLKSVIVKLFPSWLQHIKSK